MRQRRRIAIYDAVGRHGENRQAPELIIFRARQAAIYRFNAGRSALAAIKYGRRLIDDMLMR